MKRGLMLGLCLALAACAPPKPVQIVSTMMQNENAPKRFEAEGKVGLRYPECGAYESCKVAQYQLEFWWEHMPDYDELRLMDPLGKERVRLVVQGNRVRWLENGQEKVLLVQDLERELGIALPISEFKTLFTAYAEEEQWQQWRLKRRDWQQNHYKKISLEQGDYRISLAINDWLEK